MPYSREQKYVSFTDMSRFVLFSFMYIFSDSSKVNELFLINRLFVCSMQKWIKARWNIFTSSEYEYTFAKSNCGQTPNVPICSSGLVNDLAGVAVQKVQGG